MKIFLAVRLKPCDFFLAMSAKPTTTISLKVPVDMKEALAKAAFADDRNVQGFIRFHMRKVLGMMEAIPDELDAEDDADPSLQPPNQKPT